MEIIRFLKEKMQQAAIKGHQHSIIQGVSGRVVNILGGGSMEYSE
jgi:hypothetical protein